MSSLQPPVAQSLPAGNGLPCLIAHRTDGFGARLLVLVRAMEMAHRLDIDFAFTWAARGAKLHHVVETPEETFDADFLKAHYLPDVDGGKYCGMPAGVHTREDIIKIACGGQFVAVSRLDRDMEGQRSFSDAFARIKFSPRLESLRAQVEKISLSEKTVALHMRAGDIVYGVFRLTNQHTRKVISYPVARQMLLDLKTAGKIPVLFSQCAETGRLLAEDTGVSLSTDLLNMRFESDLEAAMADVFLMARCGRIYAGDSNFSILAAVAGGREFLDLADVMDSAAQAEHIRRFFETSDIARPNDMQLAFTRWSGIHHGYPAHPGMDFMEYIEAALELDPKNDFYRLIKATFHAERKEAAEAERILVSIIEARSKAAEFSRSGLAGFMKRFANKVNRQTHVFLPALTRLAEQSQPAAYFLGLVAILRGQPDVAKTWFSKLDRKNPLFRYRT